jgi:predicted ATP-grasp superfamily ATP-dependent carboligase
MISVPIVITQCHLRFGYNVLKSLVSAGYTVVAGSQDSGGRMSSTTDSRVIPFSYPDPFSKPLDYIHALTQAAEKTGAKYILPVHEDIFIAAHYLDRFPVDRKILAPPLSTLMKVHDKWRLGITCQKLNIPTPTTWLLESAEHCFDLMSALPYEDGFVIKPRCGEGARGIIFLRTPSEYQRCRSIIKTTISAKGQFLLQRMVKGQGIGVGSLRFRGHQIALSGHRRIREVPLSGGASSARKTFVDSAIYEMTSRLIAEVNLDGICMAEFRLDPLTNEVVLLDVNPRYWGGLSTHVASGVDFPSLHVAYATGNNSTIPAIPLMPLRTVESRWALGELRAFFELLLHGRFKEASAVISTPPNTTVVYEDLDSLNFFLGQFITYTKKACSKRERIRQERNDFFSQFAEEFQPCTRP